MRKSSEDTRKKEIGTIAAVATPQRNRHEP
jgi:hypothetical protein